MKLYEQIARKVGWDAKEGEGNMAVGALLCIYIHLARIHEDSCSLVHTKTHNNRDFCHQELVNLKMNAFCFSVDT